MWALICVLVMLFSWRMARHVQAPLLFGAAQGLLVVCVLRFHLGWLQVQAIHNAENIHVIPLPMELLTKDERATIFDIVDACQDRHRAGRRRRVTGLGDDAPRAEEGG